MTRKVKQEQAQSRLGVPADRKSPAERANRLWFKHYGFTVNGEPPRVANGDRVITPVAQIRCSACRAVIGHVEYYDRSERLPGSAPVIAANVRYAEDEQSRPVAVRHVILPLTGFPEVQRPLDVVHSYCAADGWHETTCDKLVAAARRTVERMASVSKLRPVAIKMSPSATRPE